MNHVRVKALKGNGKTVSKKAIKSGRASGNITPRSSPLPSLLASPTHSAAHSRVTSDASDDDGDFELDDMASSVYSDEASDEPDTLVFDTRALIEGLRDRKHNNSEMREYFLGVFIKTIRNHYTADTHLWLDDAANELAELFLHDSNRAATAKERLLSLQAFCLTVGTVGSLEIYDGAQKILKQIMMDDDDDDCRVYAIYALCMTVLYGGGLEEAALDVMEFFVEIVRTDGEHIEAHDNAVVVAAALQGWCFVASHVSDFSDYADIAMDAFVDQLDSDDVEIQSNAGGCIALIFEASRNHIEETGEPFQLQYDPQRLAGRMSELAKLSAKSVSRKHRRSLRENLLSVVTSLERGVGPFYSTAQYIPERGEHVPVSQRTDDGQAEYGYRCKLRLGNNVAKIDTWSLYFRTNLMRVIFKGGLQHHVFINPVVVECLEDAQFSQDYSPVQRSTKGRKK
ncbi:ifrd domain-containing [Trichoderma arundinaceum]|uniref:Ifrd domain-containing n=1 Tax=Trichoderma arundinaceum TaxID=490622 RepID=A0A395NNM0_TRIAR|nr:ifrd domain-containing [Trichoderma arundinaceum]